MSKAYKTLIYNDEVSLTVIEGKEVVEYAKNIHNMNTVSTEMFGKTLLFTAFLSSCLKNPVGSVSVSIKTCGQIQNVIVSGNYEMNVRGAIVEPEMQEIVARRRYDNRYS